MALLQMFFYSEVLKRDVDVDVVLPQEITPRGKDGHPLRSRKSNKKWPTLYFYHGHTGNHSISLRESSMERYANRYNLAIVCPSTHLSAFCDMEHGGKYFTYLTQELMKKMRTFLPLSDRREENFVAGISNGGSCGLQERFELPR